MREYISGQTVTCNGNTQQDVAWADTETGEVALYCHDLQGNRRLDANGEPDLVVIRGDIRVSGAGSPPPTSNEGNGTMCWPPCDPYAGFPCLQTNVGDLPGSNSIQDITVYDHLRLPEPTLGETQLNWHLPLPDIAVRMQTVVDERYISFRLPGEALFTLLSSGEVEGTMVDELDLQAMLYLRRFFRNLVERCCNSE